MNTSSQNQKDLSRDLPLEAGVAEASQALQTCTDAGSPAAENEGQVTPSSAAEIRRRLSLGGATLRFCRTPTHPTLP